MIRPKLALAHAITLRNPWAHLIAHYGKDVENRSWMPHQAVDTLLIHAGKSWGGHIAGEYGDLGDPHTSAIVAVADLAFACHSSLLTKTVVCGCGEWAQPGQCHWRLANVRALPEPVAVAGRQGLWRPSHDVLAAVDQQLGRAEAR